MNRGLLQSSPVQQMVTGNPNWWNINSMRPATHQQTSPFLSTPANLFPAIASTTWLHSNAPSWNENPDQLPESWSQLLIGGVVGEEAGKSGMGQFQAKKFENWEGQMLSREPNANIVDVNQENSVNRHVYGHGNEEIQAGKRTWSQTISVSSPNSCVTSFSSNMLDFANKTEGKLSPSDPSSESNSTASGGAVKKPRVQPSTSATQTTTFKVRKEKLGDRVTALHQLVCPFGKTDTASVLLEAIGYIRFLQSQIEALSSPYFGCGSRKMKHQRQSAVHGDGNCIFPDDPGQLLNGNYKKSTGVSEQDFEEEPQKDLRSRGLCLVPISCTLQVGSDNGADFWAPAFGGGFR